MELARLVLPVPGGPTKHRIGARASAPLKRRTARYCTMRSFTCSKRKGIAYVMQGRGLKSTCVAGPLCKLVALEMLRLLTFTGCCTSNSITCEPFVFHMLPVTKWHPRQLRWRRSVHYTGIYSCNNAADDIALLWGDDQYKSKVEIN